MAFITDCDSIAPIPMMGQIDRHRTSRTSSALLRVLCTQFIHDLLIAGLTAANAVKVVARVLADGHSLNGKGAVHIAEIALVLGRGSVLDAHGLASF